MSGIPRSREGELLKKEKGPLGAKWTRKLVVVDGRERHGALPPADRRQIRCSQKNLSFEVHDSHRRLYGPEESPHML